MTNVAYEHAIKVWKDFKRNNLGQYHNLYVHSDTLMPCNT